MLEKLQSLEDRYEDLNRQMSDPEIYSNQEAYQKLAIAHAELEGIVLKYRAYRRVEDELGEAKEMLEDTLEADFEALLREEVASLEKRRAKLEKELQLQLLPKDPNDGKNVIVEIRAGTGGRGGGAVCGHTLSHVFALCRNERWNVEILSSNATELGGFKEVIFMVEGRGCLFQIEV